MLRFKVDENLPMEVAEVLASAGHDAVTVPQQQLGGQTDLNVAVVCQQEHRAVMTLDLDFADIRAYPPESFAGIVVFRLARQDKRRILSTLERLMPLLESEPLTGKLWIVDESNVRIRGE